LVAAGADELLLVVERLIHGARVEGARVEVFANGPLQAAQHLELGLLTRDPTSDQGLDHALLGRVRPSLGQTRVEVEAGAETNPPLAPVEHVRRPAAAFAVEQIGRPAAAAVQ
jgi:hypothetical protein